METEAQPIAAHLSPSKPSATSKPSAASPSHTDVAQFFARMEHLYGHRWAGQYGKALNDHGKLTLSARQWAADLAGFDTQQIRAALQACETEHQDWPPTVPQFKALCRGAPAAKADPRMIAVLRANDALQNLLTDAKLGLLEKRMPDYDEPTRAALEAIGGAPAVLAADHARRHELGPRFVQTYIAQQGSVPAQAAS